MNARRTLKNLASLFTFSKREMRGILILIPLLIAISMIVFFAMSGKSDASFRELTDAIISEREGSFDAHTGNAIGPGGFYSPDGSALSDRDDFLPDVAPMDLTDIEPFVFDPNTVSLGELCRLGFTTKTAAGIIKYRERGKIFEIPEDFATCYGVTLEHYLFLEPYIIIDARYRARPRQAGYHTGSYGVNASERPLRHTTGIRPERLRMFDPNAFTAEDYEYLGFSPAQAEGIVRFREMIGGFATIDDIARCYMVSDEAMSLLEPYIILSAPDIAVRHVRLQVDINKADSTELRSVNGIGEILVGRIIAYREMLGGYHRVEQLAEIKGMSEENYNRIRGQIFADPCEIRKIDINFADHKSLLETLGSHPYMDDRTMRKILKERQLKGGWSSIEEMTEQNIIDARQADKLAPYLLFRTRE